MDYSISSESESFEMETSYQVNHSLNNKLDFTTCKNNNKIFLSSGTIS